MALLILNQEINKLQGVRKVTVVYALSGWLGSQFVHLSPSQNLDFSGSVCAVQSSGQWSNICGSLDCLSTHLLWKFEAKWKGWHVLVCGMFFFASYFYVECALENISFFWKENGEFLRILLLLINSGNLQRLYELPFRSCGLVCVITMVLLLLFSIFSS